LSHEESSAVRTPTGADPGAAARKRAAVELIAQHGSSLQRTARRYSLCAEDAEDAYQRSLEILLTKAPNDRINELVRWTHTVVKHEALAVRRKRERMMGAVPRPGGDEAREDWVAMLPSGGEGPDVQAERGERIARSREALRSLKPAELRALTLLAEGYSYAEIGEITGFSRTKVNRCLAEGRERFRNLVSRSEDGSRCVEMHPLLSAFCDGEAAGEDAEDVREHLRACSSCRATMRAYRATAGAAAALAPVFSTSRSLLERVQELTAAVQSRSPIGGGGGDSSITQVAAAGGTRGAGMAALAKLLTVCAGAAGGAAACVAAGVGPVPIDAAPKAKEPTIERVSPAAFEEPAPDPIATEPAPADPTPAPESPPAHETAKAPPPPETAPEPPPTEAGAVEYTAPAPPPASAPAPAGGGSSSSGSPAGEFGP
jgi:RNA polymerase sigma factor (sigma-70 family)